MLDVAIIGAGLSGLNLAQCLHQSRRSYAVFEARDRFGGRILSLPWPRRNGSTIVGEHFRSDVGPSWVWPESQSRIAAFIARNGLEVFPQWQEGRSLYQTDRHLPAQTFVDNMAYASARRIAGGAYRLIEALLAQLPQARLHLRHRLLSACDRQDHVELHFQHRSGRLLVKARQVVITIPPRLLIADVAFSPGLDARLQHLMSNTATWMAGHAKAVIYYQQAFWRDDGYSGSALAGYRGAALAEIFDACSEDGEQAALSGFFALPALLRSRYRADLKALIVEQLVRLFGKAAAQPDAILIQDWFAESCTAVQADEIPPSVHPQYGHAWLQLDHWNDKLYFCGTETASQFGGYLEGALESTDRVVKALSM